MNIYSDIFTILSSKPHNPIYLVTYIKYIRRCYRINSIKTKEELGYTEKHHICPKAKDLFPEYECFKKNPWNIIILTLNQHILAHLILCRLYRNSQIYAFNRMVERKGISNNESMEILKFISSKSSSTQIEKVNFGTHPWQTEKYKTSQYKRMKELYAVGKHPFQAPELVKTLSERSSRIATKTNNERVEAGTHHWQTEKHRKHMSDLLTIRLSKSNSRENVKKLRTLSKLHNIKLGKGWPKRSNEWIDSKIEEILLLFPNDI